MDSVEIQIISSTEMPLVVGDLQFRPITDFRVTEEDMKKAYVKLNEREDLKRDCLQKLKECLERDKDFLFRMDDSYLLRYIRHAKFSDDVAYSTIRNLYSVRLEHPEIFSLPSNLRTLLDYGCITYLPYKDQEGRPVVICDSRKWNTDKISVREGLAMITAISDIFSSNPHAQISGYVAIWDLRGVSWKHLSLILKSSMKTSGAKILQDCYPTMAQMIIGIHSNAIVRIGYSAVRYLVKKRILDRIKFLGSDMTELHQYVNPAILPKEYGGSLEENKFSTTDFVMNNLPYLKYERSFGQKSTSNLRSTVQHVIN